MSELELIYSYTRKEAIADGFQVGIEISKAAVINFLVYITSTVWSCYVEVPKELIGAQDESGRLWDILWGLVSCY